VLDLLGSSVSLLLSLLTTTEKFGVKVKGRVILNTIESKSLGVLERLTGERKTLEISIDTYSFKMSIKKKSCQVQKISLFFLPSRAAIMDLTFSTEVVGATSRARVLPARDLTKSCIADKKEKEPSSWHAHLHVFKNFDC
jgi:hypothetical protein